MNNTEKKKSSNKKSSWITKKMLQKNWNWRSRSLPNIVIEEKVEIEENYNLKSSLELNNIPIIFFKKPAMEKQKSETRLSELMNLLEKNIHIVPSGSKNSLKVGTPDSIINQLQNHSRSEFKFINKTTEKIPTSQTERERIYPTATHPSNAKKNRYPNVLANEKTMVTLKDSLLDLSTIEKKELELSQSFPGLFPPSPRGLVQDPIFGTKSMKKKSGFYKKKENEQNHNNNSNNKNFNTNFTDPIEKTLRLSVNGLKQSNNQQPQPQQNRNCISVDSVDLQKKSTDEYINANFIQINQCDKKYISCQAPLPSTMLDFWRMVWQQNTSVIVCLTDFYEGGKLKAHRYWPDEDENEINWKYYSVSLKKKIDMGGFEICILNLKKSNSVREIYHFFYTEWPDFGVPNTTSTLLHLIQLSNLYREKGFSNKIDGPSIVHCSAGLGRTGTFVALSFSLDQLIKGKYPIVHKIIAEMRDQRHGMVQTEDQYFFVFEALNDYINERLGNKLLKDI